MPYSNRWSNLYQLADVETLLGSGYHDSSTTEGSSPGAYTNQYPRMSLPDDGLHDILLNIFRDRVDPMIRILHWPSFLEECRHFRQNKSSQAEGSTNLQYSRSYYSGTVFDASQQEPYQNPSVVGSSAQRLYSSTYTAARTSAAFASLLYSVYYAAVISVIESPNLPDLGSSINAFNLAATFKREINNQVVGLGGVAVEPSLQRLQGMVLALVSNLSYTYYSGANPRVFIRRLNRNLLTSRACGFSLV